MTGCWEHWPGPGEGPPVLRPPRRRCPRPPGSRDARFPRRERGHEHTERLRDENAVHGLCFNDPLDPDSEVCALSSETDVPFPREKKLLALAGEIASYTQCQSVFSVTISASPAGVGGAAGRAFPARLPLLGEPPPPVSPPSGESVASRIGAQSSRGRVFPGRICHPRFCVS